MTANPLYRSNNDPIDPEPLVELKNRIVLYTASAPGPVTARRVYDLYMNRFGTEITGYRSTAMGSEVEDWTSASRARFESVELPNLRRNADWGYVFGSDQTRDARLFMFHGSRPASEIGRASLLRFDFEHDMDLAVMREFTGDLLQTVECVCGTAGFALSADAGDYAAPAYELMFAWAMRYWGAEAQDLDATVEFALTGFPCVSWLTVIGPDLWKRNPAAIDPAKAVAHSWLEAGRHLLVQAEDAPRLIDRNRMDSLGNYPAIANALLPFQAPVPVSFSGDPWDEDNTRRYLRRFSHPTDL